MLIIFYHNIPLSWFSPTGSGNHCKNKIHRDRKCSLLATLPLVFPCLRNCPQSTRSSTSMLMYDDIWLKWKAITDKLKDSKCFTEISDWCFSPNIPLGFTLKFLTSALNRHMSEIQIMVKMCYFCNTVFPYYSLSGLDFLIHRTVYSNVESKAFIHWST